MSRSSSVPCLRQGGVSLPAHLLLWVIICSFVLKVRLGFLLYQELWIGGVLEFTKACEIPNPCAEPWARGKRG